MHPRGDLFARSGIIAPRVLLATARPLPRKPQLASRARAPLSTSSPRPAKNQVYNPIRNPDTFYTHLSLSSSSRTPLLTFWTASWCPTCRAVWPLLRTLVESGVGEDEGGVGLAQVEFDSPDIMSASSATSGADNLPLTYMITSVPTLLSFDAGEPQTATKVVDGRKLADRQLLEEWIREEARRHGGRGGGQGGAGSLFGGLFGGWR